MTVIIVAGQAASGKSVIGKMLARELNWAILDKDTIAEPFVDAMNLLKSGYASDRATPVYTKYIRPLEYKVLQNTIDDNLQCGNSVVVSAPYLKELLDPTWLPKMRSHYKDLGHQLILVWVDVDDDTMLARMTHRASPRDDAKLSDWDGWLSNMHHGKEDKYMKKADFVINNNIDGLDTLFPDVDKVIAQIR